MEQVMKGDGLKTTRDVLFCGQLFTGFFCSSSVSAACFESIGASFLPGFGGRQSVSLSECFLVRKTVAILPRG